MKLKLLYKPVPGTLILKKGGKKLKENKDFIINGRTISLKITPKPRTLNKLIYLIFIIFSIAMLYSCYQGFKADYQAVQSLERWMK